jgi:hypothetical protein
MGGDWYTSLVYYGMAIDVPDGENYRLFVSNAYKLQPFLDDQFHIVSLLSDFHSRMEGSDCEDLDSGAVLLIGFVPSNNLEETARLGAELNRYVKDNPVLEGYDVMGDSKFFSGILWDELRWGEIEDEEEDEESESSSDVGSDELEHDEEYSDDEDNSEDDEECIAVGGAGARKRE